jgi:uncharacterized OB-fold protein
MAESQHPSHQLSSYEAGLDFGPKGEPIPVPTPISQPFFDAALEGRLVLQRCPRKGFFFYPRPRCPCCLAEDWTWEEMSPDATVISYTVERRGLVPGFVQDLPYGIGFFALADGVRMPGRIRKDLERLEVGAAARAVAVRRGPVAVFEFELQ